MRSYLRFFAAVAVLAPALLPAQAPPVRIVIETPLGAIEAEIDTARAPISGRNFLGYVDRGLYDSGRFHRTVRADNQPNDSVRIAVIQAGVDTARRREGDPPIALERTNVTGLRHLDGVLSMARSRNPDSATSDFFICVGDQPSLDFGGHRNPDGQGFAAFGRVTKGMDVVRAIQSRAAQAQALTPPVAIQRIRRLP